MSKEHSDVSNKELEIDDQFVREAEEQLSQMGEDLIANKKNEAQILQQSQAEGGPSSVQEAYINLMDYLSMDVPGLAKRMGVSKFSLSKSLNGEADMSVRVREKLHKVLYRKAQYLIDHPEARKTQSQETLITIRDSLK